MSRGWPLGHLYSASGYGLAVNKPCSTQVFRVGLTEGVVGAAILLSGEGSERGVRDSVGLFWSVRSLLNRQRAT